MTEKSLITAAAALAAFGIARRTLTRLIAAGLVKAVGRQKTPGRPIELYDRAQIEKALKSSPARLWAKGRTGRKGKKPKPPPPLPVVPDALPVPEPATPATAEKPLPLDPSPPPPVEPVPQPEPVPEPPEPVPAVKPAELEKLEPDELADMLRRLRQAEKISGSVWAAAVKGKEHSIAEQAILQRSWKDASDQVIRFEKMLPEILYKKGRYVDVERVAKILSEAAAGMASELDLVGMSAAPLCVGKESIAIRAVIDDAVRNARRNMVAALKQVITL